MTRLRYYWGRLRGSFWFLPGVMTASAVALASATVAVDSSESAHIGGSTTSADLMSLLGQGQATGQYDGFIVKLTPSSACRSRSPHRSRTAVRTSGTTFSCGCSDRSSSSSSTGAVCSRASVVSSRPTWIAPATNASTVAEREDMLTT